jgi:hypothetical protein
VGQVLGFPRKDIDKLLRELIFDNFFMLCIKKPAFYAGISGIDVPKGNLARV